MSISSSFHSSITTQFSIPKAPIFNFIKNPKTQIPNFLKTPLKPTFSLKPPPLSLLFSTPKTQIPILKPRHLQTLSLFTGIVEEIGQIHDLGPSQNDGFALKIGAKTVLEDVHLGDSIAVNGTCLTVTEFNSELSEFSVGLAPETLRKTSLIELKKGSYVNLERAVRADTRMGGHFVQGHVDGTGEIVSKEPEGDSLWIKVKTGPEILKYIVAKGYITVDGTSLTIVKVFEEESCFNFMLVDYTQNKVVIPMKVVGEKVNLEVDILGKYVEKFLISSIKSS